MQEQGCTLVLLFSFSRQHVEQGTTLLLLDILKQLLAKKKLKTAADVKEEAL